MHKTGGFLHIQQILRCDTKRARRDKECAPQHKELPLETLLELFYNIIDPTSLNKQGLDAGTQYRTGIYTVDDADLAVARRSLEKLQTRFDKPVVVECQPLDCFYTAEEYHQKYLDRNPNGYCHVSLGMIQKAKAWKPGDPTTL